MSTWILLRGLTREERHWGDFPGQLEAALPGIRVIPLDLPGNGRCNGLASPWDIAGMVAHCRAEWARRGLAGPCHLLAMSMGAMVAAAWAQAHPPEIAGCVLINTSFASFSPPHRRLRPRAWPVLLGILLDRSAAGRERRLFDLTCNRTAGRDQVIAAWAAIRQSRPVSAGNGFRQLLAAARFRAPSRAQVPTLLLAGGGDRLVDPRCSRAIARRWGCPLVVHPDAGHDLPQDDGPWVADRIRLWLEDPPAAPGRA